MDNTNPNRALIKQSDLTRYLKAWHSVYPAEPKVEVRPDGTVIMCPSSVGEQTIPSDWD